MIIALGGGGGGVPPLLVEVENQVQLLKKVLSEESFAQLSLIHRPTSEQLESLEIVEIA